MTTRRPPSLPVHRCRSGLTLLEILVVIAVVGLLFGAIIPSSLRIKSQASATVCAGKLRDIGVALNLYLGDHGMRFPVMAAGRDSREDDIPVIDTVLGEYLTDEFAFQCPSDHAGLFEETGSSYFWNSLINGQLSGNMDLLGLTDKNKGIPVVSDKENFHRNVGDEVNILYADGHVTRELQFTVESD